MDFLSLPSNSTIEAFRTRSIWLLNVRIVPNSDLFSLLSMTQRPPIVGIALLACPHHTIRDHVPVPELSAFPILMGATPVQPPGRPALSSTPLCPSPHSDERRVLWALQEGDLDSEEDALEENDLDEEFLPGVRQEWWRARSRCDLQLERLKGKTYAFLPLADVISGLPIHIHGTFQLTDNRRSLWTSVEDTGKSLIVSSIL